MKRLAVLALATCALLSAPVAFAKEEQATGMKGALEKTIDNIAKIFTGDKAKDAVENEKATGNENALKQIDKNIEKHGGSHKGLENARANVAKKSAAKTTAKADESLTDKIVKDIADGAKKELTGNDNNPDYPGKMKNEGRGKGHAKNNGKGHKYN